MAEFLTTAGIVAEVEKIVQGAREQLILVSPYIKVNSTLLERVQDADARGVATTLVYGKVDLPPAQRERLSTVTRLSLYYSERLHAKCYFNERHMVLGSMNLHEFSERHNREMGLFLTFGTDRKAFNGALAEVDSIIRSAERHYVAISNTLDRPSARPDEGRSAVGTETVRTILNALGVVEAGGPSGGHCIRCSKLISRNPEKPLCRDCYVEWAHYGNPHYVEAVCHDCGREWRTTIDRPLCNNCYHR